MALIHFIFIAILSLRATDSRSLVDITTTLEPQEQTTLEITTEIPTTVKSLKNDVEILKPSDTTTTESPTTELLKALEATTTESSKIEPKIHSNESSKAELEVNTTESSKAEILRENSETTESPRTTSSPANSTEASQEFETFDISKYTSPPKRNQSLYDELSAAITFPTFSSLFSTSSSAELVSSEPSQEENKSNEYQSIRARLDDLESTLATVEIDDIKKNDTKDERHRIDEYKSDETEIVYSTKSEFTTSTFSPSTSKKGKYLDLMPPGEDNMNASLPNAAEVWALASMRGIDLDRRSTTESLEDSEVELLGNNTIKSLLDWSEIARMDNSTEAPQTTKSSANDLTEATAELKEIAVSSPFPSSTTSKSINEDNRLELERENNAAANKSEVPNKNRDESSFELIAPISEKKNENLEELTTIEPETTTIEMTTSIVDTFTTGNEENSDIYKRTITEMPEDQTTSTQSPRTTTIIDDVPTSTALPSSTNLNARSTMVTKSISIRIATTTAEPSTTFETSPQFDEIITTSGYVESSSSATVEIMDEDKFRYGTLMPEGTSEVTTTHVSPTVHILNDTTRSIVESVSSTAGEGDGGSNVAIISITVSIIVFIVLAAGGFILFKKRKKQLTYGQRCRPVGLDAYSLDNVSVFNSVRRKANALRLSKRSYKNSAFEDPTLQSNVLDYQSLQTFATKKTSIHDEFKEIPQITVRVEEVPENCEDKNRYANVVPLPETRVHLQRLNDDEKSEYINANYVKGPKDSTNYYIATQAPLENTVGDFWRMIWQENSKVILMLTDLTENGVERCAEYMPASIVVDNSQTFGDFQVTLKSREVKGKYAVSQLHLKNLKTNTWREIMHLWYSWPESGCPTDDSSVITMLLEARSYVRTSLPEHLDENSNAENNNNINDKEKLSTLDKTKSLQRVQGPLTVHCSPGTGRTGTIIACDIVLRMLEIPPRQIDIPQIVYQVRRGRASSVRTKEQYEFIYHLANSYATKLNSAPTEN